MTTALTSLDAVMTRLRQQEERNKQTEVEIRALELRLKRLKADLALAIQQRGATKWKRSLPATLCALLALIKRL